MFDELGLMPLCAKLQAMSKSSSPGPEADEIIARQVAKSYFAAADDVVRASVQLLAENEAELAHLIDAGDGDIAAGRVHRCATVADLTDDIDPHGEARSRQRR
jgi:Arc/MetJ-type ribon-helix-helix transcriptional regulator